MTNQRVFRSSYHVLVDFLLVPQLRSQVIRNVPAPPVRFTKPARPSHVAHPASRSNAPRPSALRRHARWPSQPRLARPPRPIPSSPLVGCPPRAQPTAPTPARFPASFKPPFRTSKQVAVCSCDRVPAQIEKANKKQTKNKHETTKNTPN